MEKSVAKFTLLALPLFALTACQDYEPFTEAEVHATMAAREFAHNFEVRYGKVDPNHTWGFGPIKGSSASFETRGTEVNRNEWQRIQNQYHCKFPGWPFETQSNNNKFNGKYQAVAGSGTGYPNIEDDYLYNSSSIDQTLPAGDVTDEEIQYVSWWFRTHPEPQSVSIHLTDFFVQEISSDNDRNPDGTKMTESHIFELKKEGGQPVKDSEGNYVYEDKQTSNVPSFGMNYLHTKVFEGGASPSSEAPSYLDGFDHVNNFNKNASNNLYNIATVPMSVSSDTTKIFTSLGKTNQRLCQFYTSSGTEDFWCKQTEAQKWNNDWRLVHLQFYGPSGRFYDGYYLGWDYDFKQIETYYDQPANTIVEKYKQYENFSKDGYYSNWIVKISPAQPLEDNDASFTRRIMCEDLGNTFDFDFNDIVFDVTYNLTNDQLRSYVNGTNVDVTINLRASGGTLPICVGQNNFSKYEAHSLMGGVNSKTPINVGVGIKGHPANFHITVKSLDPDDIYIYVNNGGILQIGKSGQLDNIKKDQDNTYNKEDRGTNNIPQKFAVPNTVRWMKECEQIEDGYTYFPNWVTNELFKHEGKEWYDKSLYKDESKIYVSGDPGYTTPQRNN